MNPLGWVKNEWQRWRGLKSERNDELLKLLDTAKHLEGLAEHPGWKEYAAFLEGQKEALYSRLLNEEDGEKAENLRQRLRQLEVVYRWRNCVMEEGKQALKELEKNGYDGN